ncbi:hypothetical protein Pfo_001207 [Paulownia fortunei]|nr:hypothetical protein Pfo_001207 [Paulownia fortunei]
MFIQKKKKKHINFQDFPPFFHTSVKHPLLSLSGVNGFLVEEEEEEDLLKASRIDLHVTIAEFSPFLSSKHFFRASSEKPTFSFFSVLSATTLSFFPLSAAPSIFKNQKKKKKTHQEKKKINEKFYLVFTLLHL